MSLPLLPAELLRYFVRMEGIQPSCNMPTVDRLHKAGMLGLAIQIPSVESSKIPRERLAESNSLFFLFAQFNGSITAV